MARLTREETKQKIREKKIKRSFRVSRFRSVKNFFWWFSGVLSSIALVAGSIFIGVKVIPIKTYTGDMTSEYVSEEISSKSFLDAFLNIDKYNIGDLPIIETLINELRATEIGEGKTVGDLIEVDFTALKDTKLTDIGTVIGNSIKITATLENTVGTEVLKDFGKISVLSEWEKVSDGDKPVLDSDNKITMDGDNFTSNPKLYYYDTSMHSFSTGNGGSQSPDSAYKRAFDDNGKLIAPASAMNELYYAKLSCVPILDVVDLIDESLGRIYITELLELADAINTEDGKEDLIEKIFSDKKIKDLDGFGVEDIYLFDVLGGSEEDTIYKILKSATNKNDVNDITLGDLNGTGFNIGGVPLVDVMTLDEESMLAKILNDASKTDEDDKDAYKGVTVGDLSSLDFNKVKLSTVLTEANAKLKTILKGATGKEFKDITLGDLNGTGFNIDGVLLVDVMTLDEESMLAKILNDVFKTDEDDKDAYKGVTVGDLSSLDFDNVRLITVLPKTVDNEKLYKILMEVVSGADSEDDIKISSLKTFNMNNVSLSTVIEGKTYNPIMDKLIEKNAKIGTIGTAINGLTLYEVYGESCFTKNSEEAVNPEIKFTLTTDAEGKHIYTRDDVNGTYYMHEEDGIWLLLCFEGKDFEDSGALDTDGRPEKYVETDFTIGDLEKGDSLASRVMNATIRQLVDAGMLDIEEPNEVLCTLTIARAIDKLNEMLSHS